MPESPCRPDVSTVRLPSWPTGPWQVRILDADKARIRTQRIDKDALPDARCRYNSRSSQCMVTGTDTHRQQGACHH